MLSHLSFTIQKGECFLLTGSCGSGKSVLAKIASGLLKPSSGIVKRNVPVALVLQEVGTQILGATPLEDTAFSVLVTTTYKFANSKQKYLYCYARAFEILKSVGLEGLERVNAQTLSGGYKRCLCIASSLALGRQFIILDEPYANLDYNNIKLVNKVIVDLKAKGYTFLIITHESSPILAISDRVGILSKGKLIFIGTPQSFLQQPLEKWGIRPPNMIYHRLEDLLWV